MLIVLTQDQEIENWCRDAESGASQWGQLNVVNAGGAPAASVLLARFLSQVGANENLCITGHGNNDEIGDAETSGRQSWSWSTSEFADLLASKLPHNYSGAILMEVCADSMTSFAANLAEALRNNGKLKGVWIYGYAKAVAVTHTFPAPANLGKNVELASHKC